RAHRLRRPAQPARRRSLSLARRRPRPPRHPRVKRHVRRRRDGRPSPGAARRGCPVPSRVGADTAGQAPAGQLPRMSDSPNDVVTRAIDAVCAGDHLTADHAAAVLAEIMEGRTSQVQTAAFLIGLRAKGETVPELVGLARTMRSLATPVDSSRGDLVDTAGTGGGPSTFNVSTTAALVAAAAGCAVAKHGNRSYTSKSGSADVLEALGVNIELAPERVGGVIDEVGFGFMFAPRHHAAMAH